MTFPVFASGDVLNASDMNAVGLWLVKTQTIGSAVSSVTVTSAFSTNYDNYRIVISGGVASTTNELQIQLGSTSTGYYYSKWIKAWSDGNNTNPGAFQGSNTDRFWGMGQGTTNSLCGFIDLSAPFLSKNTHVVATNSASVSTGGPQITFGYLGDTTSYTAFTILTSTGTITGGTIKVYGYRN